MLATTAQHSVTLLGTLDTLGYSDTLKMMLETLGMLTGTLETLIGTLETLTGMLM